MVEKSRQFKRRMKRLAEKNIRLYGSVGIICPHDKFPCERSPSPIDGHPQCGGIHSFGFGEAEKEIMSSCYRLPVKFKMGKDGLFEES